MGVWGVVGPGEGLILLMAPLWNLLANSKWEPLDVEGRCALKEAKGGEKGETKEPLPLSFNLPLIVMCLKKKRGRSQEDACLFSSLISNKVLFFSFFSFYFAKKAKG